MILVQKVCSYEENDTNIVWFHDQRAADTFIKDMKARGGEDFKTVEMFEAVPIEHCGFSYVRHYSVLINDAKVKHESSEYIHRNYEYAEWSPNWLNERRNFLSHLEEAFSPTLTVPMVNLSYPPVDEQARAELQLLCAQLAVSQLQAVKVANGQYVLERKK